MSDILSIIGCDDIRLMPERIMDIITGDKAVRDDIYRELIKAHGGDMSYEWFQKIYEAELSERKKKGQDFTNMSVAKLLFELDGKRKGIIHEPTAGTGGLLIAYWWGLASKKLPWDFKPHTCIISCWELSERSVPILLLNLSIRGIMGEVFHGDVLKNQAKARYVLINEYDDPLAFSDIVRDDSVLGHKVKDLLDRVVVPKQQDLFGKKTAL